MDEVVVVLGWEAEKIREALADLPCRFVMNEEYQKGQSGSVRTGLRDVKRALRPYSSCQVTWQ